MPSFSLVTFLIFFLGGIVGILNALIESDPRRSLTLTLIAVGMVVVGFFFAAVFAQPQPSWISTLFSSFARS